MTSVIFMCVLAIIATVANAEDHVHYKFEYGVDDPHTKDHKSHYEHRDGDHVVGAYTIKEADGTNRIVKYKSGPKSGFEAVVEKEGHSKHTAGGHTASAGY